MSVIYDVASEFIFNRLLERHPVLQHLYRPDQSVGAKKTEPCWIARGTGGRISIQTTQGDDAFRTDITFKSAQAHIEFFSRSIEVKATRNAAIKVYRNKAVDSKYEGSYSIPLADPKSLQKVIDLVSDTIAGML